MTRFEMLRPDDFDHPESADAVATVSDAEPSHGCAAP
jgi:hypothetical protein